MSEIHSYVSSKAILAFSFTQLLVLVLFTRFLPCSDQSAEAVLPLLEPGTVFSGLRGSENVSVDAIVVGSGLASMVASLSILDRGGTVVVIEKADTVGGNSRKASSGINALSQYAPPGDSFSMFEQDTYKSHNNPSRWSKALIDTIVENSESTLQWIGSRLKVDVSRVAQLGGHSHPRTHRPAQGMIGAALVVSLSERLKVYEKAGAARILTSCLAQSLIWSDGSVAGLEFINSGKRKKLYAPNVILATGGFAANRKLLQKHVPHLSHLPTTSGVWATGDGVALAEGVGAHIVDMEKVQIHPTGFVDPEDPESSTKTLAAEVLRGVGGILLNRNGERFCNELGTRKYISEKMLLTPDENFYLLLPPMAALAAEKHVAWYHGKDLLQRIEGLEALSTWMGVNKTKLAFSLQEYHKNALEGKDQFNKSVFINEPGADIENLVYMVGKVTPVVHYCMGGTSINTKGQVLNSERRPIPGLYAAGEVTGGLHGDNRLGGNSLLECAVFGRIIGEAVPVTLQNALTDAVSDDDFSKADEIADPRAAADKNAQSRRISLAELKEHNTKKDCWIVVHGKVLDLTDFADQHPGGSRTIQRLAGKDGTKIFSAVHAFDVLDRPQVQAFQVGVLDERSHHDL